MIVSIIEHTSLNQLLKYISSRSHRVERDYTSGVGNITKNFFATARVSGRQVAPKLYFSLSFLKLKTHTQLT